MTAPLVSRECRHIRLVGDTADHDPAPARSLP